MRKVHRLLLILAMPCRRCFAAVQHKPKWMFRKRYHPSKAAQKRYRWSNAAQRLSWSAKTQTTRDKKRFSVTFRRISMTVNGWNMRWAPMRMRPSSWLLLHWIEKRAGPPHCLSWMPAAWGRVELAGGYPAAYRQENGPYLDGNVISVSMDVEISDGSYEIHDYDLSVTQEEGAGEVSYGLYR